MASSDFFAGCANGSIHASSVAQLLGLLASGGVTPMFRHSSSIPFTTLGCCTSRGQSKCVCFFAKHVSSGSSFLSRENNENNEKNERGDSQTIEDSFHGGGGNTGFGIPQVRCRGSFQYTFGALLLPPSSPAAAAPPAASIISCDDSFTKKCNEWGKKPEKTRFL